MILAVKRIAVDEVGRQTEDRPLDRFGGVRLINGVDLRQSRRSQKPRRIDTRFVAETRMRRRVGEVRIVPLMRFQ